MNAPPAPVPQPSAAAFHPSYHPNPPPPPSLSSTLSTLTSLLDVSSTILHSLPLSTSSNSAAAALLPCPFNPNHRIPPSSLFSHYLNCTFPISLPHNPQYRDTVSFGNTSTPSFPSSSISTTSDLCISLEKNIECNTSGNRFFYQNCPGPVSISNRQPPVLTLPRVLYLRCSDFGRDASEEKQMGFPVNFVRFLPSEMWAIQNEIETWGGNIPIVYSVRILRAILRLRDCKLVRLLKWVVASSPRYGVIIDFAMRDHIVLLVRLCLQVVNDEAFTLANFMFNEKGTEKVENTFSGLSNRNFECPILGKVLIWLGLQFTVLYGEVNGKLFAAAILKESIMESALDASFFPLDKRSSELSASEEVGGEMHEIVEGDIPISRNQIKNVDCHTLGDSKISVSQVSAAVAALHERSAIEETIRASRDSRSLSAYQRNMEHTYLSKAADEERQKRSNYRPIIEHDGLFWQRSRDQDKNKIKTREELLAEERDYKRRRMSYRGKKLKRNGVEILRDIIEEYMKEIEHQSGEIDSMSKVVKEAEASSSNSIHKHESTAHVSASNIPEIPAKEGRSYGYSRELNSHHLVEDDIQIGRRESFLDHEDFNKTKHNRNDYSESRAQRKSDRHSADRRAEKHDYVEASRDSSSRRLDHSRGKSHHRDYDRRETVEHEHNIHGRERDEHEQNYRRERDEREWNRYERKRNDRDGEYGDGGRSRTKWDNIDIEEEEAADEYRRRRKRSRSNSSFSKTRDEFKDRYNFSESHDNYEDYL